MRFTHLILVAASVIGGLNAAPVPQAGPPLPVGTKEAEIIAVVFAINEWAKKIGIPTDRAHPLFPSLRGCQYDGIIFSKLRHLAGFPCDEETKPTTGTSPTTPPAVTTTPTIPAVTTPAATTPATPASTTQH
ncbi:hypothetical protein ABW20_dc0106471 [Dactylellina cionopaga]|nr:hypothetical protein ABW20_dc0106471 [Dactylellina cionopaga]